MSLAILQEHRRVFAEKAVLEAVYGVWFDRLLKDLKHEGVVLEAGAGPGLFRPRARQVRPDLRWIALDLIPAAWNDVAADAQILPFRAGSLDAVVGVDFIHHLATPLGFFREAARVLKPGGEVRVVEPWMSPLSFPIYRFLHQEGATRGLDPNRPFHAGDSKKPFEGDAGVTRALAGRVTEDSWRELGYANRPVFTPINGFAYLMSLGFKKGSLLPSILVRPMLALDRLLPASLTAMRIELRARRSS